MCNETQVTLTQTELTTILTLSSEYVRRDALMSINDRLPDKIRKIWLENCNSIIRKTNVALNDILCN